MELFLSEDIRMVKKMEEEDLNGITIKINNLQVNLKIIKFTDMDNLLGKMEENTLDIGKIIK